MERWLRFAVETPTSAFVPLDRVGGNAMRRKGEAAAMASNFLTNTFNPHKGSKSTWWGIFCATSQGADLLRGEYSANGTMATITDGSNFSVLTVSPPWLNGIGTAFRQRMEDLIRSVVNLKTVDHNWMFDVPALDTPVSGPVVMTTMNAPPVADLFDFNGRADVVLWGSQVHFVFYKRIGQLETFQSEDRWFDDDARRDACSAA